VTQLRQTSVFITREYKSREVAQSPIYIINEKNSLKNL